MPEIAATADVPAVHPGLLWLFVSANSCPKPTLGTHISLCTLCPKDTLFHTVTVRIAQDGVSGSKTMKSGVPEVPGTSLWWPQHGAALRQLCLTPVTKPTTPHVAGNEERPCRSGSPPSPLLCPSVVVVTTNVPFAPSADFPAEQLGIPCSGINRIHCFFLLLFSITAGMFKPLPLGYQPRLSMLSKPGPFQ